MKVTPKGPGETELAKSLAKEKKVDSGRTGADGEAQRSAESASVKISPEAKRLQRISELAQRGDELRAAKVKALEAEIASGQYRVSDEDVAKSILRSEVAELLDKKK
jgi:flagellar biosynthesis anti-sigma factor FlgM